MIGARSNSSKVTCDQQPDSSGSLSFACELYSEQTCRAAALAAVQYYISITQQMTLTMLIMTNAHKCNGELTMTDAHACNARAALGPTPSCMSQCQAYAVD